MDEKSRKSVMDSSTQIESNVTRSENRGLYRTASCSIIPSKADTPRLLAKQAQSELDNTRIDKLERDIDMLKTYYWNPSPIQAKVAEFNIEDVRSAIKREQTRLKKLRERYDQDLSRWGNDLVSYRLKPTPEKSAKLKTIKCILERRQRYMEEKSNCLKLARNWLRRVDQDSVTGSENSDISDFAMLYNATFNKLSCMKQSKSIDTKLGKVPLGPLKYNRSHYIQLNMSKVHQEMQNYGFYLEDLKDRMGYIMHVLKSKYYSN